MRNETNRVAASRGRAAAVLTLLAGALALAGCGGDSSSSQDRAFESVTPSSAQAPEANGPSADDPNAMRPNVQSNTGAKEAIDLLPAVPEAFPQPRPNVVGSGKAGLDVFMARIATDVSNVWKQAFAEAGLPYAPAKVVIVKPGQKARSICGNHVVVSFDPVGPFYCPADRKIFLPLQLIDKLIYKKYGDFAVAYAVSHEWAHRIQDLLGSLDARNQGKLLTIQIETQADCFAGVWARTAYRRGLLEKGDIQEAIKVEDLIGDADGTPETDPNAHGRSGLRAAWFLTGYETGKASDCKTFG
ncbi:MAG: neutral zinc metallopeptidase [Actinobacteria bacterium]|nr:neutral zinc metallopeptidase [Actinomycetota bacterium]